MFDDNEEVLHQHVLSYSPCSLVCIREISIRYPRYVNVKDCHGRLPIHLAACNSVDIEVIHILFNSNPETIQITDNYGYLPIHYACSRNINEEVVRFLVKMCPESLLIKTINGDLPIHLACDSSTICDNTVIYLAQTCTESLSIEDGNGRLPIHILCGNECKTTKESISSSIDKRNMYGAIDNTSIDFINQAIVEVVRLYPECIKIMFDGKYLPLHISCMSRTKTEIIPFLVDIYPDALLIPADNRALPIIIAYNNNLSHNTVIYMGNRSPECLIFKSEESSNILLHYVCETMLSLILGTSKRHYLCVDAYHITRTIIRHFPKSVHLLNDEGRASYDILWVPNKRNAIIKLGVYRMLLNSDPAGIIDTVHYSCYLDMNWNARYRIVQLLIFLGKLKKKILKTKLSSIDRLILSVGNGLYGNQADFKSNSDSPEFSFITNILSYV